MITIFHNLCKTILNFLNTAHRYIHKYKINRGNDAKIEQDVSLLPLFSLSKCVFVVYIKPRRILI